MLLPLSGVVAAGEREHGGAPGGCRGQVLVPFGSSAAPEREPRLLAVVIRQQGVVSDSRGHEALDHAHEVDLIEPESDRVSDGPDENPLPKRALSRGGPTERLVERHTKTVQRGAVLHVVETLQFPDARFKQFEVISL